MSFEMSKICLFASFQEHCDDISNPLALLTYRLCETDDERRSNRDLIKKTKFWIQMGKYIQIKFLHFHFSVYYTSFGVFHILHITYMMLAYIEKL